MQKKIMLLCLGGIFSCFFLLSHTSTREEKDLLQRARQERFEGMPEIISFIKESWSVLEHLHKGVGLNKRIHNVLDECWRTAYQHNDASYATKITDADIVRFFEQFLIELNPSVSYYQQRSALDALQTEAYAFVHEPQTEYRQTIEKAHKLILKHLKSHIPTSLQQEFEVATEGVFKEGIHFLLLVLLKKYNKNFSFNDEQFIRTKIEMFLAQMGRQYPYVSAVQFESWAFSLMQDLLVGECQICMDRKSDTIMPCCKARTICKKCYAKVYECPFCRAPKKN